MTKKEIAYTVSKIIMEEDKKFNIAFTEAERTRAETLSKRVSEYLESIGVVHE